jgi:LmbE family N-acetylglucosaminyl deacetylase
LCIGAHQDDIEIMAYGPIAACYGDPDRFFSGVTVTDGDGSPRTGVYADYTNQQMKEIRAEEQNQAAFIGRYAAQVALAWPSAGVKDPTNRVLIEELKTIILAASPDVIYTHNIADKHDTHVAVAMHVIRAVKELPEEKRPRLIGMEVWRALDWLCDEDKVVQNTAPYPNVSAALLGVYDSQISGGKRYDLATQGRRLSNATFFASHAVDDFESSAFGLDMTPLVRENADPVTFITGYINKFKEEVENRVRKLT